eukprot:1088719-Rhodomonas_salina.1
MSLLPSCRSPRGLSRPGSSALLEGASILAPPTSLFLKHPLFPFFLSVLHLPSFVPLLQLDVFEVMDIPYTRFLDNGTSSLCDRICASRTVWIVAC